MSESRVDRETDTTRPSVPKLWFFSLAQLDFSSVAGNGSGGPPVLYATFHTQVSSIIARSSSEVQKSEKMQCGRSPILFALRLHSISAAHPEHAMTLTLHWLGFCLSGTWSWVHPLDNPDCKHAVANSGTRKRTNREAANYGRTSTVVGKAVRLVALKDRSLQSGLL